MQYKTFHTITIALLTAGVLAAAEPTFRTDANNDEKLKWFQLEPSKFPPAGSAHYFAGELIGMDHVERTAVIRADRTDAQRRSNWDQPVGFEMLPYGSIYYHGSPAALRDIPIGTHLHGEFYVKGPKEEGAKSLFYNRRSIDGDFTRCFRLEDDLSYYTRRGRAWRVDAVDLEAKRLTVTGVSTDGSAPDEKPTLFDLSDATRVWKGRQIGTLKDIAPGQIVQTNITWATIYGPGRCLDVWLDKESRDVARDAQLETHRQFIRERGIPGWVDAVDNKKGIVTVTLFVGVDPTLLEEFKPNTSVTGIVAEPTLQGYDQVNDRKAGPLVSAEKVDAEPGSSGVRVSFQPSLLLEGFRPGRIVRLFPNGWPVRDVPLEERLWPARD